MYLHHFNLNILALTFGLHSSSRPREIAHTIFLELAKKWIPMVTILLRNTSNYKVLGSNRDVVRTPETSMDNEGYHGAEVGTSLQRPFSWTLIQNVKELSPNLCRLDQKWEKGSPLDLFLNVKPKWLLGHITLSDIIYFMYLLFYDDDFYSTRGQGTLSVDKVLCFYFQ